MNYTFGGNEPGLEKPLEHLRSILIPNETLEAWAIQRRVFALSHRRLLLAATSGRLILLTRKLLGGFDVSDIRWQDLEEVTLRVGMLGADLACVLRGPPTSPPKVARARSGWSSTGCVRTRHRRSIASAGWRRIRRGARSAGCASWRSCGLARGAFRSPAAAVIAGTAGGGGCMADAVRRLQEAKQMLDGKLITDAEYEAIKAKIVSS